MLPNRNNNYKFVYKKSIKINSPKDMRPLLSIESLIWLGIDAKLCPVFMWRFLGGFSGCLGALRLLWWCLLWEWVCELPPVDAANVRSEPALLKVCNSIGVDCARNDADICKFWRKSYWVWEAIYLFYFNIAKL